MRRLASQVPEAVSRLQRAGLTAAKPTWYQAVLANPAPVQPARSTVQRTARVHPSSSASALASASGSTPAHSYETALYDDVLPRRWNAQAEGTTRTHKMKHFRERKPRPEPIVYEEDRVRRQFFKDFPYEALRPTSLVEGRGVRDGRGEVKGREWVRLEQRGMYPTVEDTIAYILNLHHAHGETMSNAYWSGTHQFVALRGQHEQATIAAELEARHYGAIFKLSPFDRVQRLEQAALSTITPPLTTSSSTSASAARITLNSMGHTPSNKVRPARSGSTRWSSAVPPEQRSLPYASGSGSGSEDIYAPDATPGAAYVRGWTLPPPLAASTMAKRAFAGQGEADVDPRGVEGMRNATVESTHVGEGGEVVRRTGSVAELEREDEAVMREFERGAAARL